MSFLTSIVVTFIGDNKLIQMLFMVKAILELPSVHSVIIGYNLAPFSVLPIFSGNITRAKYR